MKLASQILEFAKNRNKTKTKQNKINLCNYFAHPWKIPLLFNITLKILLNEISQEKKCVIIGKEKINLYY